MLQIESTYSSQILTCVTCPAACCLGSSHLLPEGGGELELWNKRCWRLLRNIRFHTVQQSTALHVNMICIVPLCCWTQQEHLVWRRLCADLAGANAFAAAVALHSTWLVLKAAPCCWYLIQSATLQQQRHDHCILTGLDAWPSPGWGTAERVSGLNNRPNGCTRWITCPSTCPLQMDHMQHITRDAAPQAQQSSIPNSGLKPLRACCSDHNCTPHADVRTSLSNNKIQWQLSIV
jgi:hypothetical protein